MWQLVFMINGYLISVLGCVMLMVGAFDMYSTSQTWSCFLSSALLALFIGMSLFLSNRADVKGISMRQAYLLTTSGWVCMALLASVPFLLYGSVDSFSDAFFESMSGLSATGATIFHDIEAHPKAILLWRSILNAMGGIGVLIFAVALLPFLGIGGMQIFQRENSDINDKFMPKFHYIAKRILLVYFIVGTTCAVCFKFAGMNWFDAINHAMATTATGGFSTKNASIGYYDSVKIEMVASTFMLIASLPMTFYIVLLLNKFQNSLRTEQVVAFLKIITFYILATAIWLKYTGYYPDFLTALRFSSFNVISVTTTTGFVSTDFLAWGALAGTIFIIFSLTGGCTGSTTGSIKIFRWQAVWAYLKQSLLLATDPDRIVPIKIKKYVIENSVISSVLVFLTAYFFVIVTLTIILSLGGLDFATALSAVITCITNTGPGVVDKIGPVGNYAWMSSLDKNTLSVAMLLGRLEILTVLVVFTKNFWRK